MLRDSIIEKVVKNKNVLDVGSVGQSSSYSLWNLYAQFRVKSLVGIDIDIISDENRRLFDIIEPDKAYDIVAGNMETYQFNKKFDVVVAGDVIEHVGNQSLFLQNIRNHLVDNGKLIITTPNAKWPVVFLKPNPTHTLWHDIYTLRRILNINGFEEEYSDYYEGNEKHNILTKIFTLKQSIIIIAKIKTQSSLK